MLATGREVISKSRQVKKIFRIYDIFPGNEKNFPEIT
jgi:hypothetical protein